MIQNLLRPVFQPICAFPPGGRAWQRQKGEDHQQGMAMSPEFSLEWKTDVTIFWKLFEVCPVFWMLFCWKNGRILRWTSSPKILGKFSYQCTWKSGGFTIPTGLSYLKVFLRIRFELRRFWGEDAFTNETPRNEVTQRRFRYSKKYQYLDLKKIEIRNRKSQKSCSTSYL